jgi:hypothetical protein
VQPIGKPQGCAINLADFTIRSLKQRLARRNQPLKMAVLTIAKEQREPTPH